MSSEKSSSLNRQISELEERIRLRRASSSRHLEELQNTVSDNITESQRNFHDKLSSPGSLLTAFGIGFVLDRIGSLGSSKNKSDKALAKDQRKAARRQQKKTRSTSMLDRIKTTVTLVTATVAILSRLDDYMDKVNKKTADPARTGSTAGQQRTAGDHTVTPPPAAPAESPDNSGRIRP
jgi:hypothetical protein